MLYLARKVDEDIFVTDLNGKVLLRLVVAKARSGEVSIAFDEFTEVKTIQIRTGARNRYFG